MVEGTLLRWSYLSPSSLLSRSAKFNSGGGSTRSRIRRGTGGVRKLRFHPSSLSYVSLSRERERERKSKVYSFVARAFPLEKGYIPTQREKIVRWTPLGKFPGAMSARCNNRSWEIPAIRSFDPPPLRTRYIHSIAYDEISIDDEKLILIGRKI